MADVVRVAYLTGEYPRATDGWIQREIAALRDHGVVVDSFAVRRPGDEHLVGPEQRLERSRTTYLYEQLRSPRTALVHLRHLIRSPRRYAEGLRVMWRTKRPGVIGGIYQLAYFAEAGLLADEIRRRGIPHLHNHLGDSSCSVAMLASTLGGFSYSFTLHGPAIFFEPYTWRLDEKIARAAFCACISYFSRSQAAIFASPDHLDRLHIVHCGIVPETFRPVEHAGTGQRLLFVGRLAELKGLAVLLEAMVPVLLDFPGVRLTVVGDGPQRARFESLARRLGIGESVRFTGYRSQSEVAEHLSETDVFVLPSYAEGVPVTLMEASASSVPVVATRVGGIGELVEDGVSGYLVRPGDPDELADRLKRLIADADLRRRLGAAGRAKVEAEFTNRDESARLRTLFANAIAGRPSPLRPPLEPAGRGRGSTGHDDAAARSPNA